MWRWGVGDGPMRCQPCIWRSRVKVVFLCDCDHSSFLFYFILCFITHYSLLINFRFVFSDWMYLSFQFVVLPSKNWAFGDLVSFYYVYLVDKFKNGPYPIKFGIEVLKSKKNCFFMHQVHYCWFRLTADTINKTKKINHPIKKRKDHSSMKHQLKETKR